MEKTIDAIEYLMEHGCNRIQVGCEGCPLENEDGDEGKISLYDALSLIDVDIESKEE